MGVDRAFIDIADNHYAVVLFSWHPSYWVDRAWYDVIDESGTQVNRLDPKAIMPWSYTNHETAAWGENGANPAYHNRVGTIWGHSLPNYTFMNYSVPTNNYSNSPFYQQYHGSNTWHYGKPWVVGPWVKGAEVDQDDLHIWILERIDFYCVRFTNLTYDNAFFGTGAQTDADNGFNKPLDLTRDNQNNFIALDELSDGTYPIKGFDVSGSNDTIPADSLGGGIQPQRYYHRPGAQDRRR